MLIANRNYRHTCGPQVVVVLPQVNKRTALECFSKPLLLEVGPVSKKMFQPYHPWIVTM